MRMIMAAVLLIQAAPAQSEADKLEAALKNFGDRNYRILDDGKDSGTMTMKTRIESEGDKKAAIFEDKIALKVRDSDVTMTLTEKASLPGLRLMSANRVGKRPRGDINWHVTVRDGKATMKVEDHEQAIDVTAGTVGELAVMRLVCAAEQKEGGTFKLDVLSMVAERLGTGHEFRCVGKEPVEINGRKLDAFKWEEKGEWKITRKIGDREVPGTSSVNNSYWVNPDGFLLRFRAGRLECVLDAK